MWLSDRGLWVGDMLLVDHGAPRKGLAELEAMLAVAFRKRLSKSVQRSVTAALDDSRRGDQGLANLRLAVVRHARIADAEDLPLRMAEAKRLLATGLSTDELLAGFAVDGATDGLKKFDPEQLRVPAGSGRESGRWAGGQGSTPGAVATGAIAFAPSEAPLLAPSLGAETLAALATFAETVGLAAVLGTLFVPSPNATSRSGPLPGDTENTYSYDHEDGLLRVLGPSGFVLAAGRKDSSGVFYDADTRVPFARELDGALLFDSDSVNALTQADSAAAAQTEEEEEETEPKLCPDPGPDQPGALSASARAKAYQAQISLMTNPQRPLPPGLAMNLLNPATGKIVHYDECDEQSGTMIEAKGPGFNRLLSFPPGYKSVTDKWLDQGDRELQAAGSRQVVWYFAEDQAALVARNLFDHHGLGKIIVRVQPPW